MRSVILGSFSLLLAACSSGSQANPAPAAPAPSSAAPAAVTTCATAVGTAVPVQMVAGEHPRLSLEAGCVYLATLDVSGVLLRLYPRSTVAPKLSVVQVGNSGEAGSRWEVRNAVDGSYGVQFTNETRGRAVQMKVIVTGSDSVAPY